MRKEFSQWLKNKLTEDSKAIFITADLGFQAFEEIQKTFPERFLNVGVAEQNMILIAAGLAAEGFRPICYSIAPFAVFRPYEQSRLNLGIHNLKVMIVGNGGGYGYGIMGATHHALEDLAAMSALPNFKCFVPISNEDVFQTFDAGFAHDGPSYLRMGFGVLPATATLPHYSPIRRIQVGNQITVLGLGPVALNALNAVQKNKFDADLFAISEAPILHLPEEFKASVKRTGKLLVLEEHVSRGGIGEMIAYHLMKSGISVQFHHRFALGYPTKLYGSQKYHQGLSHLDEASLSSFLSEATQK
jgi:transketolase